MSTLRITFSARLRYAVVAAFTLVISFVTTVSVRGQTADRSTPPQPGQVRSLQLPPFSNTSLSNGIPVLLLEKHNTPLVELRLVVKSGVANEAAEMPGLASMMFSMLTEGAGSRSALELADAIDFLGADISAGAGVHSSTVSLFTSVSKLDDALPLFADVAMRPTFPAAELERLRADRLTGIKQWKDQPRTIASLYFNRRLFGSKHPYGRPAVGNVPSLLAMKPGDLRAFHAAHVQAANVTLIVVGDVTATSMMPRLEKAFGALGRGKPAVSMLPAVKQVAKRRIVIVNKPGAAQSEIRIGRIGAARNTPDYYALIVMNTLLGGSFSSRLNQNLREKNGYTYGARSSFVFRQNAGPFLAAAAVQ